MRGKTFIGFGITLLFLLVSTPVMGGHWILDSTNGSLPADLEATILAAGGTLVMSIDEVGIAVADFATREDAEVMEANGFDVMPDVELNWLPGVQSDLVYAEHIGQDETFYGYQWHLPQIQADLAWDTGYTGAGARVAVVDSGIWYLHPDLYDNVDFASSASFVDYTTDFLDDDGHGTHVAGIIAAADNNWGSIGIAPNATLVGVKVLTNEGWGYVSWIAAGIIHAADQDVDIINLSLGGYLWKNGNPPYYTASDAQKIIKMYRKALNYAASQGALVVHAAGNEGLDLDHMVNLISTPGEVSNGGALTVSATGPIGLADFDRLASYSNYGKSVIDVAAPGGDYTLYPADFWWYDMVFSTGIANWYWSAGTSMAAPNVAGVAALIVSKYGSMNPSQLKHKVIKAADDIGPNGTDSFFGKGRVNAYEAVK